MKKILFFTHKPISHLIPIEGLINYLQNLGYEIYAMGFEERREYFINKRIHFIPYFEDIVDIHEQEILKDAIEKYNSKFLQLFFSKQYQCSYENFMKMNAINMHYITKNSIKKYEELVIKISPDIIFHDIVDLYAPIICKKLNIKRVDYITNSLYSEKFFLKNPLELYPILTRTLHIKKYLSEFLVNYWDNSRKIYKHIENKYDLYPILPLNQFQMDGDLNLIFSASFLQPEHYTENVILFNPNISKFAIENAIPSKLQKFITENEKIFYISQGSFLSEDKDFYEELFKKFKDFECSYVISCGKTYKILEKIINKYSLKEKVYFADYLPQKFILNNSQLFLTSGGINSILESIYYQVPMIINPISAEQRMNGYLIENLNLGVTLYSEKPINDLSKLADEIINNRTIKFNLELYSKKLKSLSNENAYLKVKNFINYDG